MQIGFSRNFKRLEITFIGNVIKHELSVQKVDLDFLEHTLSFLVLFEFYKENLSVFIFPEDDNFLTFSDSQAIAFLHVFGLSDDIHIQSICQEVIKNVQTKGLDS